MIKKLLLNNKKNKIIDGFELNCGISSRIMLFGFLIKNKYLYLDLEFDKTKQNVWVVSERLDHSDYMKLYKNYIRNKKISNILKDLD